MAVRKKISAGILAACMGAGLLAGCGSSSDTTTTGAASSGTASSGATSAATTAASSGSGDSTSMVFAWWGNQVRNEETQNAINVYMEQNPNITIEGQFSQWGDYWQKLATLSAGNNLPDIIQQDYAYVEQYTTSGQLYDLTEFLSDGTLDSSKWNQSMIDAGTVDGKFVAVCAGINAPALMYDKAITDAAGVTIKDNMTLDEFIEVSKTIYEKTGYKTNMAYGGNDSLFTYLLRADDVILFEDDKIGATADQLVPYYQMYVDGFNDGWMMDPEKFADRSISSVEQDALTYGDTPDNRSWCAFQWSNMYIAVCNNAQEGQDIQMTTWPSKDPKKSNYLKAGQFFSVSRDAKNPKEAAKFIDWLINSEDANDCLLGERGIPMNSDIADYVVEKLTDQDKKVYTYVEDVAAKNSSNINPPDPAGASEAKSVFNQIFEQLAYGQLTPEQAAEQLITEGSAALAAKAAE